MLNEDAKSEIADPEAELLKRFIRIRLKWDLSLSLGAEDHSGRRILFNEPIPKDSDIAREKLERAIKSLTAA